jgi:hypothetical protein
MELNESLISLRQGSLLLVVRRQVLVESSDPRCQSQHLFWVKRKGNPARSLELICKEMEPVQGQTAYPMISWESGADQGQKASWVGQADIVLSGQPASASNPGSDKPNRILALCEAALHVFRV